MTEHTGEESTPSGSHPLARSAGEPAPRSDDDGAPEAARDPAVVGSDPADGAAGPSTESQPTPLDEIIVERPVEAVLPMRSPLALAGTVVVGGAMGVAELVPGFSGGTVAFVAGIYERLVATIRQGARTLSLLVRGRPQDAYRAFMAIEWLFVTALAIGMLTALFTVAATVERLIDERPVELQAVFLGLVLGAAVLAARQLRRSSPWNILIGVAAAAVFFVLLGFGGGELVEPNGLWFVLGGALAVSAWILPGVSGSFLLLVLGLYTSVIAAASERALVPLALFAIGCVIGLALFSTVLNWLLARAHDIVLAVLIGLMVASARVLWPWPVEGGIGNPTMGPPDGPESFLAIALMLTAFALLWMFGLLAHAVDARRQAWRARRAAADQGAPPA